MNKTALVLSIAFLSLRAGAVDQVRLKNARELYASYEATMGIDGKKAGLHALYLVHLDRLPQKGLPEELFSNVVLSATELAGAFCKKAVDQEKLLPEGERTLFFDIDFNQGPSQFTTFLRDIFAEHLAILFWQRSPRADELAVLSGTILAVSQNRPELALETEEAVTVICTTVGTSLAFLVK